MEPVDCQKKPMFGYPAFFINGNMFAGLFQDKLFLRLSPEQVASLSRTYPQIANLEPMPGRPMRDYFVIPEKLYRDGKRIARTVQECASFCRSLAPKSPSKPRKKKGT